MIKPSLKLTVMLSVACNAAWAAQGIPAGPFRVLPEVAVDMQHDNNVTQTATNEISSFATVLSPQVTLELKQSRTNVRINAGTQLGFYFDSSEDDYTDAHLSGNANLSLGSAAGLSVGAQYKLGHDPRGSTDRVSGNSPAEWDQWGVKGLFRFGHEARIGIEAGLGYTAKAYDLEANAVALDDFADANVVARFFFRVLPKTRLFAEADYTATDYDVTPTKPAEGPNRDSDSLNLSVGLKWDATAKTSGSAQIGYLMEDFDAETYTDTSGNSQKIEDFSGVSWKVGVDWKPLNRSVVNIATSKYNSEATGVGYNLETTNLSASWTHNWMDPLSTTLGFNFAQTDFEGDPNKREDDVLSYKIGAKYNILKWASVGANVTLANRNSSIASNDYDQTIFSLTFKAAY